jgi:hypothetical protein
MIVGDRQRVEAALEQGRHARIGAKAVDLAVQGLTLRGNRTFEVADGVVGVSQLRRKRRQRIAATADQTARPVVEHDVADEDQAHALGASRAGQRQAESERQQGEKTASPAHCCWPSERDSRSSPDHSHQ